MKISLVLFVLFFSGSEYTFGQSADSTYYYQAIFQDEGNICNGQRREAFDYLSKQLKVGMKFKKIERIIPGEYKVLEDQSQAWLVISSRCDAVDEESYLQMALFLVIELKRKKLVRYTLKNIG